MTEVLGWNSDKPHRCPACHAVAVDMGRPSRWRVYTCCRCEALFTRWPGLAWLLPKAGVRCAEHRPPDKVTGAWLADRIEAQAKDAVKAARELDFAWAAEQLDWALKDARRLAALTTEEL